ncbi:MAG: peptidylprolyl isomerase [Rikenellaceae bacterium]
MKKHLLQLLILALALPSFALAAAKETKPKEDYYLVTMQTNKGTVQMRLFNDTPKHRDNFVKLINEGFYNQLLFHRVISDFMIQCGDPDSREALSVAHYGDNGAEHTIEPEITPNHFHKRGALAAAREGDDVNPDRLSSGSHFYIVVGYVHNDSTLQVARERIEQSQGMELTSEREKAYRTVGGTPHLDGSYTVFGEVTKGMAVVDKISQVRTTPSDRPRDDIYIKEISVELIKAKK